MIEGIVDQLRENNRRKSEKKENEYTISEILQCREKSRFIREDRVPRVVESDVVRQGWIGSFIRDSMQNVMKEDGWSINVKFNRDIGKYRLSGFADAWKGVTLVLIKCPMRPLKSKKIPDAHLLQARMLLNLADLERCLVLYIQKEEFREIEVKHEMSDDDITWFIEDETSPYYPRECSSCFYKEYCDVISKVV